MTLTLTQVTGPSNVTMLGFDSSDPPSGSNELSLVWGSLAEDDLSARGLTNYSTFESILGLFVPPPHILSLRPCVLPCLQAAGISVTVRVRDRVTEPRYVAL